MLNLRPNLGTPYPKLNWAMGMPYWEAVELSIHRARQCWDPHWSLKRGYDNETADAIWNRMLWAIDEARLKYASPNPDENVYIRKWSHYEEWFHTNDTRFEWWREYYQERSAHIGFVVEIMGEPGYGERGSPVMDLHTRRLGTDGLEMCNYNTILNRYTTGFETAQRTYAQIYRWLLRKSPLFRRIAIWAELNVEMREPGGHFGVNTATGDAKFYTWLMQPRKWYQVYCSIVDIDSHSQASVLVKWNYDWGVGEMVRAVSERWCNQALGYARRRVPKFEYLEGQFVQWAGVVGEFSDGIRAKGCSNLCK
ncbi:hypothetical protein EJ08DRAFT_678141 [Tothia fuscella]|uniref:Uncharacterized protein n=1 Tax=Tothia fuscella TaxID=1048955 RepID=A0A9P4U073_9PEZI|nr:hypothetical protein EJ08DRAFT_678141 [Tothia fuscella]